MYYSDGSPDATMIGLATSEDGLIWDKHNIEATDGIFSESDPVMQPSEDWERLTVWMANVRQVEDGWEMFYGGQDGRTSQIGYAFSEDGLDWIKASNNPIVETPTSRDFYDFPAAFVTDEGEYRIYYSRNGRAIHLLTGTLERE